MEYGGNGPGVSLESVHPTSPTASHLGGYHRGMTPGPPVILDDPPGTALGMNLSGQVVLTRVRGLPYLWDILERSPQGLLVRDGLDLPAVRAVLDCLELRGGEFFYLGPELEYSPLTPCERRVLQLIAFDMTNAQIAERFGIKTSTVNSQVSAILAKLGVPSRHAARALYWGHPTPPTI